MSSEDEHGSGTASLCIREGNRSLLVEVQALVDKPLGENVRQIASGISYNRLQILLTILKKHGKEDVYKDVIVSTVGGIKITDTDHSGDLAILAAIVSSLHDFVIDQQYAFIGEVTLTDNSKIASSVQFNEAGRVFQLVSGSAGTVDTTFNANGYTANSGSYGWVLPDVGVILLNPLALADFAASGGIDFTYSGSAPSSAAPNVSPNTSLFTSLELGEEFKLNSEETITSDYVFVRPRSSEFNYSENPSFISGSTGEVVHNSFINNPQVYITTVGLYNDSNELLAVAKLSRPLLKDFTKEALVRVKLDF